MSFYLDQFVFSYRRFGTNFRSNIPGTSSPRRIEILAVMGCYSSEFVFSYRRFGKCYRSNLQVSSSQGSTMLVASVFTQILHYSQTCEYCHFCQNFSEIKRSVSVLVDWCTVIERVLLWIVCEELKLGM